MRVCIDVQSAITQRAGVGRYTRELVRHMTPLAAGHEMKLVYFDFLHRGREASLPPATHRAVRWCPGRIAQGCWKWLRWPPYDLFSGPADVFHFPNFTIPPLRSGKTVVTIHDMSFARLPDFAEQGNLRHLRSAIRDTAQRADAVIAVSQFSADEIYAILGVDKTRIFPIHQGIDPSFHAPDRAAVSATLKQLGLDKPFLLSVGTLEPRKSYPFLIDVFERVAETFTGDLVIAGMAGWKYEPILERIRLSPFSSRIRWLKYVGDAQLPALYAGAELFVFTSLYEGFGFPPLEAMACGTPVVSSAHASLKEVLGSGATLMKSYEPDLWAEKIKAILPDPDCRRMMTDYGLRRAAQFTWEETARKTWDVYRKVAP